MPRVKPILTYTLAAVVLLWVVLGVITLPNANRWFRGSGHSIQQDTISFRLDDSSPSVEQAESVQYSLKDFNNNVFAVDNTPNVPDQGLEGVLYYRGDACSKQQPGIPAFVEHHNISKVALIVQNYNCFLTDKIIHAQNDGAVAAIIYHNASVSSQSIIGVMPKTVKIPTYYVDHKSGMSLLTDLDVVTKSQPLEGYSPLLMRVNLLPNTKPLLDHWQFALVIVGVMLMTSIIAITIMQCHMWRLARQQQEQDDAPLTLAEQRQVAMDENYWRGIIGQAPEAVPSRRRKHNRLEQAYVNLLPTRIFRSDSSDEKRIKSVESLEAAYEPSSCVICLEQFEDGDVLRRLPCNHEYHRDCVDVWLTKKNASCPLCLQQVEVLAEPDQVYQQPQAALSTDYYYEPTDLATAWQELSRNQDVVLRMHPFSYNPTTPSSQRH